MRKLIINDLDESQCQALGLDQMGNDDIIINSKQILNYCIGCFGCWLKTPGTCIIRDEFQHMGENLSKVEELLIISKSSFGSFSSSVKNVLDRSISYVMPFFEIRKGEMHHAERYHKNLLFSTVIYGEDITESEKEIHQNLVKANAVNLNATMGKVHFVEKAEDVKEVLAWF